MIHLVGPDGSGDRILWQTDDPDGFYEIDAQPAPIDFGTLLFPHESVEATIILHMALGPTPGTTDQVLYQGSVAGASDGIYLATRGGATP